MKLRILTIAAASFAAVIDTASAANCPPGTPLRRTGPQVCVPQAPQSRTKRDESRGFAPGVLPGARFQPSPVNDFAPVRLSSLQFAALAKRMRIGVSESSVVKALYDVKGKQVHFIDTNRFSYHIDFAMNVLGYRGSNVDFNKNYGGALDKRQYAAVSLVLQRAPGENLPTGVLLELWTGDTMDAKSLRLLAQEIQAALPEGLPLKIHPLSTDQENLVKSAFAPGEYILTSELLGDISYIALNTGVACGFVKFAAGDDALLDVKDIAVFEHVPNDVGLVGGVVTAEPQTPLSHVNVKSMNRGTANMYLKNAKEVLKRYEGRAVELKVEGETYKIREFDPARAEAEIAKCWEGKRPKINGKLISILDPKYDDSLVRLDNYYKRLPSREEHQKLIRMVGAKAANLSLLNFLTAKVGNARVKSPGTMAIPFNFYEQFMNISQAGLDTANPSRQMTLKERVTELLKKSDLLNPNKLHSIAVVRPALAEIRSVVSRAQVPESLIKLLKVAVMDDASSPIHISKHPRLRLRSSTNSEDLEGFTGAGLYDSDGVNLYKKKNGYDKNDPKKWPKIEEDLREVIPRLWSGVWNERAFLEREWYQMNGLQHLEVKGGLALHGAFPKMDFDGQPGEVVNGVAVTANIYDLQEDGKIYLNSQHFDLAVTNPPTIEEMAEVGEDPSAPYTTEEIIVTSFLADEVANARPDAWTKWPYQRLRTTSVKKGEPVLKSREDGGNGHDEIRELASILQYIHNQLAVVYRKDPYDFAIDVEWKLYGKDRTITIKQARPFAAPGLSH